MFQTLSRNLSKPSRCGRPNLQVALQLTLLPLLCQIVDLVISWTIAGQLDLKPRRSRLGIFIRVSNATTMRVPTRSALHVDGGSAAAWSGGSNLALRLKRLVLMLNLE
jgi:hypothetical protein